MTPRITGQDRREELRTELGVPDVLLIMAAVFVVAGSLGPWATYTPFHIFDEPPRQTAFGASGQGWLAAVPAAALAFLVVAPLDRRVLDATSLAVFCWTGLATAFSWSWAGFMASDVVLHWGLPMAAIGSVLGLVAALTRTVKHGRTRGAASNGPA